MELFEALLSGRDRHSSLSEHWRTSPVLSGYLSLAALEEAIGRLDDESDDVVSALLAMPLGDPLVAPVLLAGLRHLIFLCRGRDRELRNDLVTEVAIAIGELRQVRPARTHRRLGYVIVDRGRDRQRAALRRQLSCRPVDPLMVAETVPTPWTGIEESVIDRVRIGVVREQIIASGDPSLARSWNSLVELIDTPRRSQGERDRWKYIRRRLAGNLDPDAA